MKYHFKNYQKECFFFPNIILLILYCWGKADFNVCEELKHEKKFIYLTLE